MTTNNENLLRQYHYQAGCWAAGQDRTAGDGGAAGRQLPGLAVRLAALHQHGDVKADQQVLRGMR